MEYMIQYSKLFFAHDIYPEIKTLELYIHTLYSKLELVKNQSIKGRGAPALSEARSAETGQSAWIWLISHYDQCLGHSEATIVKANIGHFTLLIKLLLLKPN